MKIKNFAVLILVISLLSSIFIGIFKVKFAYISVGLLIISFCLLIPNNNFVRYFFTCQRNLIYYALSISILIIQAIINGNFVGYDCGLAFIMYSILFQVIMSSDNVSTRPERYLKIVERIYKLLIVLLIIEVLVVLFGQQNILVESFPGYREDNRADILAYFNLFPAHNAPNSIFFGRQIAGTITLFAFILFFEFEYYKMPVGRIWLMITLLLYVFTATGFVIFMTFIAILLYLFVNFNMKRILPITIILAIFLGILWVSRDLLLNDFFARIFSTETLVRTTTDDLGYGRTNFDYYLFSFFGFFPTYANGDILSMFFGFPKSVMEDPTVPTGGDFALGFNLLRGGAITIFLFIVFILRYPILYFKRNRTFTNSSTSPYFNRLRPIAIITLLYFLSFGHYQNVSVIIFFSFQCALLMNGVLFSRNKINMV